MLNGEREEREEEKAQQCERCTVKVSLKNEKETVTREREREDKKSGPQSRRQRVSSAL